MSSPIQGNKRLRPVPQFLIWIQCFVLLSFFGSWIILMQMLTTYLLSVFILLQFIWSFWSWKTVTGNFFDPYTIFLLAAYLFNGGKAILEVFRLNERGIETFVSYDGYLIFSFPIDTIKQALVLVFIGLGALHLGALVAASRGGKAQKILRQRNAKSAQASRWVGWFLILISLVPAVVTLVERYRLVMQSGYFGLFQRAAETGFGNLPQVLAGFMVPGVLFLVAGSKSRPGSLVFSALLILPYLLIQAFTGTRLWWAMFLVAYIWLWHRWISPIPKIVLWAGGVAIVFVVFPSIMVVRNLPGEARLSLDTYIQGFLSLQNPVIAILEEMGGSLVAVAHTLELIPTVRDFDFGSGYLYSILTIFPNLFWEIHPTLARGLYSHWLIYTVNPATFYAGGGYGFSFIGEAYANSGWVGTPIVISLIGFLLAKFVLWAEKTDDPAKSAAVAAFLAFFLIYARGESALVVRPLIWYALGPYLLTKLLIRTLMRKT
jgi:oligosaccharide repeat unit polymerase